MRKTNYQRPITGALPVTRPGDLWVLGDHRLLCGDALRPESYAHVLGTDKADMVFADPPFNVRVEGHASGLGAVKHTNFAMASGELSRPEFQEFLQTSLGHAASSSTNGAIHFVCMDWRHLSEVFAVGEKVLPHVAASGRCWRLLPQGRPSSRSSIASAPARPAQAKEAAACRYQRQVRGRPLFASRRCKEGA